MITTAQVVFIALLSAISGTNAEIGYRHLHSIIVTAFVGILPTFIFIVPPEKVSRNFYFLLVGLHFILTFGFVFVSLNHFGTFDRERLIPMIILFLTIYITVHIITEIRNKKAVDELNKRINATHND